MKNIRTLLAVGFLAFLTSCSSTKETTNTRAANTSTNKIENNRGRSNQDYEKVERQTSRKNSSERVSSSRAVRNNDALDRERFQSMYTMLNLDDTQKTRFENEWQNSTNSWKSRNRNKTMNSFERTERQDRIMKNILDESQFEVYQKWAREHPITD